MNKPAPKPVTEVSPKDQAGKKSGKKQGNLPYAPHFDHMIYVRVFEGCNLHCEHCFIPHNPKKMEQREIAQIAEVVPSFAPEGSSIMLQWHGGEPTMFGADWLREAMDAVEEAGPQYEWLHGIQTNLMTYDDSWAQLYHDKFHSEVGVSWDPKIRLMRKGRPESNEQYEEKFWANWQRVLDDGLNPYLTITATAEFFRVFSNPFGFFDFLEERGIKRVHLERITRTGYARENWERLGLDNMAYSRNMARYLRAYVAWQKQHPERAGDFSVSPLDGLLHSAKALAEDTVGGYGCWSGHCDTTFHTFDASGYKKGCTALTSEYDNSRAGDTVLKFPDFVSERKERQFNCGSCQFRKICSTGCLALDIEDGSGECSGGYKLFSAASEMIGHMPGMEKID